MSAGKRNERKAFVSGPSGLLRARRGTYGLARMPPRCSAGRVRNVIRSHTFPSGTPGRFLTCLRRFYPIRHAVRVCEAAAQSRRSDVDKAETTSPRTRVFGVSPRGAAGPKVFRRYRRIVAVPGGTMRLLLATNGAGAHNVCLYIFIVCAGNMGEYPHRRRSCDPLAMNEYTLCNASNNNNNNTRFVYVLCSYNR